MSIGTRSTQEVREALIARREIALLDVREEDPHAQAHPLFAANLPLSLLDLDAYARLPRRNVPIVVLDDGEGLAPRAAERLVQLGYTDVSLLDGGLAGWRAAGGEIFRDVNVPSKSFGELVESVRHTPSLSAEEVQALIDSKADVVVVDARRFDEYNTMSIPSGISVPGAELALRIRDIAPNPATRVIVNCAGRTRSIIGTQSLVNNEIPNPVSALRNGTIGWTLAGQKLEHGQQRRFGEVSADNHQVAAHKARSLADRAGVLRASLGKLERWRAETERSLYLFDVRTPEEYAAGHLPGFLSTPGGQLVQETEMVAPVRGARIVLVDTDGVRANMTASWLAQMNWDVHVLDEVNAALFNVTGASPRSLPDEADVTSVATVGAGKLATWLDKGEAVVVDLGPSAQYVKRHVPGAWFVLRSQLAEGIQRVRKAPRVVLTSTDPELACFAARDLKASGGHQDVHVLEGGNAAWFAAGLPTESGEARLASPRIDRYRRPYEGTDNAAEAMQAYLDWEYGLVEQLGRDGTHGFRVI
ncbi:rhodanese-related sulfurtransferase [Uliginosibacterium sp. H3]|uniref:Rhodanese-related sulfurtransferase n=1 Tax=Uliginosibacterium silvisoli TaxID=3114758 RepID=A0ABU6K2L4_9RHOO|nr:rhodanese-related sulfurtransferase [Uliginosibacterium sp. H3]